MTSIRAILKIYFVLSFCTLAPLMAQSVSVTESVVPAMVKFAGVLNDTTGKPLYRPPEAGWETDERTVTK